MKRFPILILLSTVLFLFFSCGPNKIQEGEVEYVITYPNSDVSGFMQAILPETMTITFKGTKIKTTIARGTIFTTEIISDEKDKSVEMRLDFGDKLYYTVLNESEVKEMIASQPKYSINATGEADSVVGMYSSAYTVSAEDTIKRENAWFTNDLATSDAYWFTSYAGTEGFPVIYDVERYGVMMHLEAVKLTKREVKETEFDRAPELTEVSFQEYEAEVQELFDILME